MAMKLTLLCNAWLAAFTAAGQQVCSASPCREDDPMSEFSLLQTHVQVQALEGECERLKTREFIYSDFECGKLTMTLKDFKSAFIVEKDYWKDQGAKDPWWAVDTKLPPLTGPHPEEATKLKFYQKGVDIATKMQQLVKGHRPDWVPKGSALDFGCGLGRMSHGIATLGFDSVVCVDQTKPFLEAAESSLKELAATKQDVVHKEDVSKLQFVQSGPDLLCNVQPASFDFVHSIITLQHMKPVLQVSYIEQLCDALRPGGTGYFQIPVYVGSTSHTDHCSFLEEQLGGMALHYTPADEVAHHLEDRGCKVVFSGQLGPKEEKERGIGRRGKSFDFVFTK